MRQITALLNAIQAECQVVVKAPSLPPSKNSDIYFCVISQFIFSMEASAFTYMTEAVKADGYQNCPRTVL